VDYKNWWYSKLWLLSLCPSASVNVVGVSASYSMNTLLESENYLQPPPQFNEVNTNHDNLFLGQKATSVRSIKMEQKMDLVSPLKMFFTPIHRTFGWKSKSIPEATKVYYVAQADPDDINLECIILHY
jgi:hypothetical protein